jgi:endoplasmic reticulum protein 29
MKACLILASFVSAAHATAQGAIKLDNYTFDKMVSIPQASWLVKIDKNYAYGDKEDAFKELCKLGYVVPNFFIGEIPVQDYGDKDNSDLAENFGVKSDDYPAFFLIQNGGNSIIRYKGFADPKAAKPHDWDDDEDGAWEPPMLKDVTAENLRTWLKVHGVKMPAIGTISELDDVAKTFMKEGMKDSELAKARKLAEDEYKNDRKAPMYVKIMEKIQSKGADYVQQELARVKKLLAGKITAEKKDELSDKVKILNIFAD